MKAVWKNKVIADSDNTIIVEGNYYFPPESVSKEYLKDSVTTSKCPWKGQAKYYDIVVDGELNKDAAWYYSSPLPEAKKLGIKNHVAFWKGVEIIE